MSRIGFGAKSEADDVHHGIGIGQFAAEHVLNRAVVGRKSRLILGETAFHLDFILDVIAKAGELV